MRAALSSKPASSQATRRMRGGPVAALTPTGVSKAQLQAQNGKAVVEVNGTKVLLALDGEDVRAVSNKCTHLGLSLQGKATIAGGCVTCNAHGSRFNLTTGAPEGEWCPKLPNLPIIGKGPGPKPLPTYKVEVGADGAISVDA